MSSASDPAQVRRQCASEYALCPPNDRRCIQNATHITVSPLHCNRAGFAWSGEEADLARAEAEAERVRSLLYATAKALHLSPGSDLNAIPAAAAATHDANVNLREQLDRANTERQRLAEELSEARAETQEIAAELAEERTLHQQTLAEAARLRGVLRDILGHFTDKGSIGGIHNALRTCWVTTTKVDGWRAAHNAEAGERRG